MITIKKNKEFRKVYNHGYSAADKNVVIYKIKNSSSTARFGYTVSKKIGKAVVRNKIRRRLKEICRLNIDKFDQGYDYIIIARIPAKRCSYWELQESVFKVLKKLKRKAGR